jgi:excisionase family DNA binding protein
VLKGTQMLDGLTREELLAVIVDAIARLAPQPQSTPAPVIEPVTRLLTAAEVAERLRFKLAYVYEMARAGKIRSLQEGKYLRFTEAALSEYIAANDSAVDCRLSHMLSVNRDSRTVQKHPRRARPHANGNGAAAGRASDDN